MHNTLSSSLVTFDLPSSKGEKEILCFSSCLPSKGLVEFSYSVFKISILLWNNAKLCNVARLMLIRIIVSQFTC